jgi:predicted Zn-dependent peptidase
VSGLRVDHAVLDDGLRVVGEHNPAAASTAVGVVVETGSRDERPEEHGVSHFLEHLCFKGDDERTGSDVSRAFDALGARYNAYTSEERTVYYGAVLPEAAPALLELLDGMLRPALRAEDIEVERQVVLEEIAMYADRPDAVAFERGARAYFDANAFGRGVLGTEDSVRGLDAERVRGYWDRRYGADNQLVVLTGRYDWDATLRSSSARGARRRGRPGAGSGGADRARPAAAGSARRACTGRTRRCSRRAWGAAIRAAWPPRCWRRPSATTTTAPCSGPWSSPASPTARCSGTIPPTVSGASRRTSAATPPTWARVLERVDAELERVQREGVSEGAWRQAQRTLATGLTLRGETPMGRLVAVASSYLDRGRVQGVQEVVDEVLRTERSAGEALLAERPFDARYTFVLEPGAATAG